MKPLSFLFFLSIFCLLFAQDPNKIIQKHFEFTGGEENWNNLNSIILEGESILGFENIFNIKIYHRRPYFKRVVFIIDGKEVLNEGYDGEFGYTFSQTLQENIRVPQYKPDAFENDLLSYQRKGYTAKFIQEEPYEDRNCYLIELTKNKNKVNYCFDTDTYQLLWEEDDKETLYYSNFVEVKGLIFAQKLVGVAKVGEGEYSIIFSKIQVNPVIEEKLFKFKK